MTLILASQSPYRKQQLQQLGLEFQSIPANLDESSIKAKRPEVLAKKLATLKAKKVAEKHPKATIIGSDQLVALGKQILGKPGSLDAAKKQLKKMSGKKHKLITAVAVYKNGKIKTRTITALIKMRKLTDKEISAYVKLDQPIDCAGSYKFEKAGMKLIKKIKVSDPSSIIGLPLIALCDLLEGAET